MLNAEAIQMTQTEIESFLAVCRYQTVTQAAQRLYITQPSLSARLKTLEKELGGPLFHRRRGNRAMSLTPAGKRFYELALQYEAVTEQMLRVCRNSPDVIRVSAINSVSTYFLPKVYDRFLQDCPGCHLELQDMELPAAAESILNGATDLAFIAGHVEDEQLIQTPVYAESMVLIGGRDTDFSAPVTIQQLQNSKEIYVEWSRAFASWHQRNFKGDHPRLTISIMTQLKQFMQSGDCWAIVPVSIADGLAEDCELRQFDTQFRLPDREISAVTAAEGKNEVVPEFFRCMKEVIREFPRIRPLI